MPLRRYIDIADFGLHLVSCEDSRFAKLLRAIQQQPQPFLSFEADNLTNAAVLLNESGKAIVVLAFSWRYTGSDGASRSNRFLNLGSSAQTDILTGRSPVPHDFGTCILSGSKRLLTERGMFGNNLDVLPLDAHARGGFVGASSRGNHRSSGSDPALATELSLDLAIFEDGLCVGPDQTHIMEKIAESLDLQRTVAGNAAAAIRSGMAPGAIFEMLLPSARRARSGGPESHSGAMLSMFARMAIDQLVNSDPSEQLLWFERFAQPSTVTLRRPSV